jgi:predicted ATPase/DNA-binding SARP family transcriptional activator/Tfp pilus assembly protein PilF
MNGEERTGPRKRIPTLHLFGPFEIEQHDVLLPRARTRKEPVLLALLALRHDLALDRDWLAGMFWPDSAESQALYNLRRSLGNLRQMLGPAASRLQSPTPRTLRLDVSNMEVDVLAFDAALAAGEEADLERAVALYRGPLLESYTDAWILPERAAREEAYLNALEALAASARERQDTAKAIRHLRAVVLTDPLRETGQRALLQALIAQGDLSGATEVYRRFRLLLHRELQTEPSPETAALYQRIRAQVQEGVLTSPNVSPAAPPRHLPHPLTKLIGRTGERAALQSLLTSTRLITLTGAGGIGKTRLAIAVAEQRAADYSEGVWFVEFASLLDGSRVAQVVASALGLMEEAEQTPEQALLRHLKSRRLLLILDNCEHLIEPCARLAERLLTSCPGLTILATSRQSLGVSGERLWHVPPLSLPEPEGSARSPEGEPVPTSEAVCLFRDRAAFIAPSFAITSSNRAAVAQICRLVEGIPFAIELAVAWLRVLTVEQLAARLSASLRLLSESHQAAYPHQQTLRATLDGSYSLLEEAEKRALARLTDFAGGCTLEAAEALCSEREAASGQVLGLLSRLVDKSLVVFAEEDGQARYQLLEITREYAAERLSPEETALLQRRHADYFLQCAEKSLEDEDIWALSARWYRRVGRDYENYHAALLRFEREETGTAKGLQLAAALRPYWEKRGLVREGRSYLTRLLARTPPEVTPVRAGALYGAGALALDQSDPASACTLFREALAISRALGNRQEEADTCSQLGVAYRELGEYAAARTILKEALAIRRRLDDRVGLLPVLTALGNVARDQGDYATADACYTECLELSRASGQTIGLAYAWKALGSLAFDQGRYEAAEDLHRRSLASFRELEHLWGVAFALSQLGALALVRKEVAQARCDLEQSLAIWQRAEDRWGIACVSLHLGRASQQEGDTVQARALYQESLRIVETLGNGRLICEWLEQLGGLSVQEGRYEHAALLLSAAESARKTLGTPLPPSACAASEDAVAAARHALGDARFFAIWQRGGALSLEQAALSARFDEKGDPL